MKYVPLPRFLFRAPLLPARMVTKGARTFRTQPLAGLALNLASPDLTSALEGSIPGRRGETRALLALDRYRRRAAFRPTPHGLWAGVGLGALAPRSRIDTGAPSPHLRFSWARLAELARTVLEDRDARTVVRLRRAPSLIAGAREVIWLGFDSTATDAATTLVEKHADMDDVISTALAATVDWKPWPAVRSALAEAADPDEVDELLLVMIDDGLLHTDLTPPIVGPDPQAWFLARLEKIPSAWLLANQLKELARASADRPLDWEAIDRQSQQLPGEGQAAAAFTPTLLFNEAHFELSRGPVARAAELVPLLFRLQNALSFPVAERVPTPALADALDATTELFGAGALSVPALISGAYGVTVSDAESRGLVEDPIDSVPASADTSPPPPALMAFLVNEVVAAASARHSTVELDSDKLASLLPDESLPPTCELFLTPTSQAVPEGRAGEGWLLGLHAPAGASWGRFGHALGKDVQPLFEALTRAEAAVRPGEQALDVVFVPAPSVADVCTHPPVRAAALALTAWPSEEQAAVLVDDLELCADPTGLEPSALRTATGLPVSPTPLQRVRSSLAPTGLWRLLAGWTLHRQHAPWAMTWGPLMDLDWTPRITLDGFVIAPASWRIPPTLASTHPPDASSAVAVWRRTARVPRFVQVGAEDELLPVDLAAPTAITDLAGQARVFEIWPPLEDTPDTSGRRVEAVVALVAAQDDQELPHVAAAISATADCGAAPPPRDPSVRSAAKGWQTYKLFGTAAAQDEVILNVIAPAITAARAAGDISAWFFLRYVDGPGNRPHLRLRVRANTPSAERSFTARLAHLLAHAQDAGEVVAVERTPYFPELARYGGPLGLAAAHAVFEADSALVCALLALQGDNTESDNPGIGDDPAVAIFERDDARLICLVAVFDQLARGFGLDARARVELAERRLDAHDGNQSDQERDEAVHADGRAFRGANSLLRTLLADDPPPPFQPPFTSFRAAVASAASTLDSGLRGRLLAPLLHLAAVRLLGADRPAERRGYALWARTLTSLSRHPVRPR